MSRRFIIGLLLLFPWLTVACGRQHSEFSVESRLEIAEEHIEAGAYTAAESVYDEAIRQKPDDPTLLLNLAKLYQAWGRPESGLAALQRARDHGAPPEETQPLYTALLADAEMWPELETEATAISENVPQSTEAFHYKVMAQLGQQKCKEVTATVNSWHLSEPENAIVLRYHGILEAEPATLCEGDAELCATLKDCTDNCLLSLGRAVIRSSEWPLAVCVLQQALQASPNSAEVHLWLGEALDRTDNPEAAREHLDKAVALSQDSALPWLLLGIHTLRQGEFGSAREALLSAHKLDSTNPAPCLGLTELKANQGYYTEVDTWAEATLARAPGDAEIWKAVARIYLERGLHQGKFPDIAVKGAANLAPEDAEALMLLGWANLNQGDANNALLTLDKALEIEPELAQAHYLRGLTLQMLEEREKAQDAFTRAADLGYWP